MLILLVVLVGVVVLILAIAEARRMRELEDNRIADMANRPDRIVHEPDRHNQVQPELFDDL